MTEPRTVTLVLDALGRARALRVPQVQLRVVKGPDRRKEKRAAASRLLIGSSESSDFVLGDPTVSAVHCELTADSQGVRVRDLGSKNGTCLDGLRLIDALLGAEQDLQLGNTTLRIQVLDAAEERALAPGSSFGALRGSSPVMREIFEQLSVAASSDSPLLLVGETGTGKGLAAEAVVASGPRASGPFVVIHCGALPLHLAESELFGHVQGAFTGASRDHAGAFERANGGTVVLDEVSELSVELQPKFLGVLERGEVQRVGGNQPVRLDVRVIALSSRELEREVNRGAFRADLYYRLAVLKLRMPSLREHREDIPDLVASFLEGLPRTGALSPSALERLYEGSYPGNVRELRNAVERLVLSLEPLPSSPLVREVELDTPFRLQKERLVTHFERVYLQRLLEACRGNISEAARRSGLSRVHLHGLIRRLGLRIGS